MPTEVDSLSEKLATATISDQVSQEHEATLNALVVPPIPLQDTSLDKKLRDLGEKPGLINSENRSAYQAYLDKIQAGVQPEGDKRYKSKGKLVFQKTLIVE